MAGIEHDYGLCIWRARQGLRNDGRSFACRLRRLGLLQLGLKRFFVGGHEIDDEARRLVVAGLEHERLIDEERPAHIDDDARFPRGEQAVTIGRDKAPLFLADAVRHLEIHVRRIDDDPIGIAQGKDMNIDLLR